MRALAIPAVLILGLSGCSAAEDPETVGRTGVTSAEGDVVVVWSSCGEEEIASVALWRGGEETSDDSSLVGEWETGQRNREESLLVPGAKSDSPALEPGQGYVAQARPAGDAEELAGVYFTPEEVAELAPGEVLLGPEDERDKVDLAEMADC